MTQSDDNGEAVRSAHLKEHEQRQKLYDDHRSEADRRHLSNAENFDKAVLAYSSAGLGFSLAFLKDVIRVADAPSIWIIKLSWCLFAAAIFLVVVSYPISQQALQSQLEQAEAYYKGRDEKAFDSRSIWERAHYGITIGSGIAFCLAMILTTYFVIRNVDGVSTMTTKRTIAEDGAINMKMQKAPQPAAPVEKGSITLPMQRVTPTPAPTPSQPPAPPQSK